MGRYACAGDLIALVGDLGTGKTLLVQGVAEGLGVDPSTHVSSPTFAIMHRYPGRLPLYHIDLYRIDTQEALLALGLEEYLEGEGVAAVEWAEHGVGILPRERLTVRLRQTGPEARTVELLPTGDRYEELVRAMTREITAAPRVLS